MTFKAFPSVRWSPEGERKVFHKADDVPEGWSDKHPSDPNHPENLGGKKPEKPKGELSMSREEIVAALTAGEIEFSKNAPTKPLYAKLRAAIEDSLTADGIEFDPDATTKDLYEVLTTQE